MIRKQGVGNDTIDRIGVVFVVLHKMVPGGRLE
jgi:hypothetical protein